jgi:hypothetical protein
VPSSFLVNFVYCHPIGHVIEALHYANGYRAADPSRRVSVTLNENTATELADHASFVERAYPVPMDVFDTAADHSRTLSTLPSAWDVVVSDFRGYDPAQRSLFRVLVRRELGLLHRSEGLRRLPQAHPVLARRALAALDTTG